jgi:hypothetical protein
VLLGAWSDITNNAARVNSYLFFIKIHFLTNTQMNKIVTVKDLAIRTIYNTFITVSITAYEKFE